VLKERIAAEYGLDVAFEATPYEGARWIAAEREGDLEAFVESNRAQIAEDGEGAPVFLGKSAWEIGYVQDRNPAIRFRAVKERAA
jgi:peptide chain release factor 3